MSSASNVARVRAVSLKDQNRAALTAVLLVNLVVLVLLVQTGQLSAPSVDQFIKQWRGLLPAGVGVVFAGVVNGLLGPLTKARLVFWRWSNPLPGSFAFSRHAARDPRIDLAALRSSLKVWPSAPHEQNALWYRLYKLVDNDPAVVDAHRYFLLTRDYTAIAFLLLLVATPLGLAFLPARSAAIYGGILLLQYLLGRQAASNYGVRFVTTVLALKASK